jgi:DinB family protein
MTTSESDAIGAIIGCQLLCGVTPGLKGDAVSWPICRIPSTVIIQVMDIQELCLKQKEASRMRTRQVTSLLREDHLIWRPVPGALSIGEMLRHLWVSEQGVRNVALNGDFSYYEKRIPGGLSAVLGTPRTIGEEIASLESTQTETLAAVAALPLDRWEVERVHEGLGFRRKIAVILFGMNEHEVHHRAQLMTYLRMIGTPAPEAVARR